MNLCFCVCFFYDSIHLNHTIFVVFCLLACLLPYLSLIIGTMLVRADNDEIDNVEDLKDKVIGALAISDFAGAQVQFYVMKENGLDYIMDPKQVIFTGKQKAF